jgi:Arc/MetJ-type ribon-helix-helix transcriptional regulator
MAGTRLSSTMKLRKAKGRPKLYGEEMVLTNFRFPRSLLDDIEAAKHALGLPSVAEVVRKALNAYLEVNGAAIRDYKRLREKHGTRGEA